MDLAALLASALKPGALATGPGAYSAQGSKSNWIMPGRDVRSQASTAAAATDAHVPLPPRDPRKGASSGAGADGRGGGSEDLSAHQAATGVTVGSPPPYMYGDGSERIPQAATGLTIPTEPIHEAATGMTYPAQPLPHPNPYGPPGGEAATGLTTVIPQYMYGGNEVIPEAATGETYPPTSLPHPNAYGPPGGEAASGLIYPAQPLPHPNAYGPAGGKASSGVTVPSRGFRRPPGGPGPEEILGQIFANHTRLIG